jgi:hypothetical protein
MSKVTHINLTDNRYRVLRAWYVVTLICGLEVWTSRQKYNISRKRSDSDHWLKNNKAYVCRPGDLTSVRKKVTCLGCIAALALERRDDE